jgi:hypothetical protein
MSWLNLVWCKRPIELIFAAYCTTVGYRILRSNGRPSRNTPYFEGGWIALSGCRWLITKTVSWC